MATNRIASPQVPTLPLSPSEVLRRVGLGGATDSTFVAIRLLSSASKFLSISHKSGEGWRARRDGRCAVIGSESGSERKCLLPLLVQRYSFSHSSRIGGAATGVSVAAGMALGATTSGGDRGGS